MELRHFLAGSTILYAITVYLFGAGQSWGIRNIWYYYVIMGLQVRCNGITLYADDLLM